MFNTPFAFFKSKDLDIFVPKILYLGNYTSFNGSTTTKYAYASTFDSITTTDPNFSLGTSFNAYVYWGCRDSKNRILLGGSFTTYRGTTVNRIVRLNHDGTLDTTFNTGTGFNADVRWIEQDSQGRYYVGGLFTTFNGNSRSRILRLNENGTLDTTFNPTTIAAQVNSGVLLNDEPIILGYFTSPSNGIVKFTETGATDTSFTVGTGFNITDQGVFQIKKDSSDKLYVVGLFTSYNGTTANGLVKLNSNGTIDTSLSPGTGFPSIANKSPYNITIQSDGKLLVGGYFEKYRTTNVSRLIRLQPNGDIDTTFPLRTFAGGTSQAVRSTYVDSSGDIYIGGVWTTYNSQTYPYFIKTDNSGSVDTNFLDATTQFNNTLFHVVGFE